MVSSYEFNILELLKVQSNPDSVEWCPVDPYKHYFTCATYKLASKISSDESTVCKHENEEMSRTGQIYLYEIKKEGHLKLHQTIETQAILDIKWCNRVINGYVVLAAATASGKVIVWKLFTDESDDSPCLTYVTSCELQNPNSTLVLSLDWSTGYSNKFTSSATYETISVSDSNGMISLLQFTNDCELIILKSWKSHAYEAWIVAYNYWDCNIIFSGGDDCALKLYDVRLNHDSNVIHENRDHTAGVTSLRCNHVKEYSFVSGSYDENVKFWDTRNMKCSVSTLKLNGGIWRMKWHPVNGELLLTAAMFDGFHLISSNEHAPICSWKLPDTLSYGADLCYLSNECLLKLFPKLECTTDFSNDDFMLTSMCTFYDNTLILSLIGPPAGYEKLN